MSFFCPPYQHAGYARMFASKLSQRPRQQIERVRRSGWGFAVLATLIEWAIARVPPTPPFMGGGHGGLTEVERYIART